MRFLIATLTLSGILVLGSIPSSATPIKVDLKKLVDQAENAQPYQYIPARVGWNGPETPVAPPISLASLRQMEARQWLVRLALPDVRMLGAFAVAIFGLRFIRRSRETRLDSAIA